MAGGIIAAAVMGVAATAVSTASQIAANAIKDSKSNLAFTIDVINGTEYELTPVWSGFRKGAFLGGIEGEFALSPRPVDPRGAGSFACTQILGATTDVIGAVVYQSDIFYWLIGFHAYDQFGIQRYIYSGIFPKVQTEFAPINFRELDLWRDNSDWGPNLNFWPNQLIWSGAGPYASKQSSKNTTAGRGMKVVGPFKRGAVHADKKGNITLDDKGQPVITHTTVTSKGEAIEFSSQGNGGAKEMNVVIFDEAALYTGSPDDAERVATMTTT